MIRLEVEQISDTQLYSYKTKIMHLSLQHLGFKQRIIMTVAVLVAVALSITNWLSYNNFKHDKIATIEQKSRLIVDSAKREIELSMQKGVDALESTKAFYQGPRSDSEYVEVAKMITKAANYASFTAGYSDGRAYGDSGGDNGVFDVSDYDPRTRDWYQQASAKKMERYSLTSTVMLQPAI